MRTVVVECQAATVAAHHITTTTYPPQGSPHPPPHSPLVLPIPSHLGRPVKSPPSAIGRGKYQVVVVVVVRVVVVVVVVASLGRTPQLPVFLLHQLRYLGPVSIY